MRDEKENKEIIPSITNETPTQQLDTQRTNVMLSTQRKFLRDMADLIDNYAKDFIKKVLDGNDDELKLKVLKWITDPFLPPKKTQVELTPGEKFINMDLQRQQKEELILQKLKEIAEERGVDIKEVIDAEFSHVEEK